MLLTFQGISGALDALLRFVQQRIPLLDYLAELVEQRRHGRLGILRAR